MKLCVSVFLWLPSIGIQREWNDVLSLSLSYAKTLFIIMGPFGAFEAQPSLAIKITNRSNGTLFLPGCLAEHLKLERKTQTATYGFAENPCGRDSLKSMMRSFLHVTSLKIWLLSSWKRINLSQSPQSENPKWRKSSQRTRILFWNNLKYWDIYLNIPCKRKLELCIFLMHVSSG